MIVGFLTYQMRFKTVPDLEVLPVWSEEMEFRTELDFKLRIRMMAILVRRDETSYTCLCRLRAGGACGLSFFNSGAVNIRKKETEAHRG